MKLAVLSDVHGNLPALEAVLDDIAQWQPDRVVVNGDLVSRGPRSMECLRLARRALPQADFVEGNHEAYVLWCRENPCTTAHNEYDIQRLAQWTCQRLGDDVDAIAGWPDHLDETELDGGSLHITHGSRLGNRDGIHPRLNEDELSSKLGDPRDLFVGSHTHIAMVRNHRGSLVVNTGSVGQPFDGDKRASYGRFYFSAGSWRVQITRVNYDYKRAQQDFIESGFIEECGPLARLIHYEYLHARPHMGTWMRRYKAAVIAGETTAARAVEEYMGCL